MRKDFRRNRRGFNHSESHRQWAAADSSRLLLALPVLPGKTECTAATAAPNVENRSWEAKIAKISAGDSGATSPALGWQSSTLPMQLQRLEAVLCKSCYTKASWLLYSTVCRGFYLLLPSASTKTALCQETNESGH